MTVNEGRPSTVNRHVAANKICNHFNSYGLLCDEYDQLKARAAGRCEICDTAEAETTRGTLVIDHFQGGDLFFVRGLVCDRCNGVMARHDRKLAWGPATKPFAERARAYHLRSWGAVEEGIRAADELIAARRPWVKRIGGYDPRIDESGPP